MSMRIRIRRAASFMIVGAGILLGMVFGWQPQRAWATISPGCGACNATPVCYEEASGEDGCHNPCTVPPKINVCQVTTYATCDAPSSVGTYVCGGGLCQDTKRDCSWTKYGFALPGDADYGFPDCFSDPDTLPMLGLIAKGPVVFGNPFSPPFISEVVPRIGPDPSFSITQPYLVDPTDASLGYDNYTDSTDVTHCGGLSPCFDGNYDQPDGVGAGGQKFYEPTMSREQFQTYFDDQCGDGACDVFYNPGSASVTIDAVLFTNHALVGYVPARKLELTGAMVSRDEALVFNQGLLLNHDIRLLRKSARDVGMPASPARPQLRNWQECTTATPC